MKSNKLIFFCFVIVLFSCINKEGKKESDIEIIKSNLSSYLSDLAFKNNNKIKIHSIQIFKIDTIDKKQQDSSFVTNKINEKIDSYKKLIKFSNNIEAKLYEDSTKLMLKLSDSILKLIKSNKNIEKVYKTTTLLKATFYYGKDSTNFLDTIYPNFKKDLKVYFYENSDYKINF